MWTFIRRLWGFCSGAIKPELSIPYFSIRMLEKATISAIWHFQYRIPPYVMYDINVQIWTLAFNVNK